MSRRSFVQYTAAGVGVAVVGSGVALMANRPPLSPRQQGLPKIPDWTEADMPSLTGRSVIVTGANGYPVGDISGLGYHTALQLARVGADVTIASRNKERGEEAIRQIKVSVPGASIRFETLDLADLASVEAFAGRMRASQSSLDILVNNAGVMARKKRELSVDGFERVFATNTLGHFALTARLLPMLREGKSPRVVWLSSMRAHGGSGDLADLKGETDFDYSAAYDHSKLAVLRLAFQMQARSAADGWGVSSIAAHPGVARTNIITDGPGLDSREGSNFKNMHFMFQPPAEAVLSQLYAAAAPAAEGGAYYGPNGATGISGLPGWAGIPEKADDETAQATLWATLEKLGGATFRQQG
jgi:NAD(P)-dependent dehydrogenase (short-subunit alcohol dehydrogenase family)